jgi:hypothetical protein
VQEEKNSPEDSSLPVWLQLAFLTKAYPIAIHIGLLYPFSANLHCFSLRKIKLFLFW